MTKRKRVRRRANLLMDYYGKGLQKRYLDEAQKLVKIWAESNTTANQGTTIVWTRYTRRTTWEDVLMDWGIFKVSAKWTAKYLWSSLTTMRDFLLIRSRSCCESLASPTQSVTSSSGWTDKPAPSSTVGTIGNAGSRLSVGHTNMTYFVGSPTKKQKRRSYGTDGIHRGNYCCVKKSKKKKA